MATTTPMTISSDARARLNRLDSRKISGVSAAHVHDSRKATVTGPLGSMGRNPGPRGSSSQFAEERTASSVQKEKMMAISRQVSGRCTLSIGCKLTSARRPCRATGDTGVQFVIWVKQRGGAARLSQRLANRPTDDKRQDER